MSSQNAALPADAAALEGSTAQASADMSAIEIPFHGTCRRCSHFHIALPIELPSADKPHRRYHCHRCNALLFGLGRRSTQISLASQETVSSSGLGRASADPANLRCVDVEIPTVQLPERSSSEPRYSGVPSAFSPESVRNEFAAANPSSNAGAPRRTQRRRQLQQRLKKIRDQIIAPFKWIRFARQRHQQPRVLSPTQQPPPTSAAPIVSGGNSPQTNNAPSPNPSPSGLNVSSRSPTRSRGSPSVPSSDAANDTRLKKRQLEEHRRQRTIAHRALPGRQCFCSALCACRDHGVNNVKSLDQPLRHLPHVTKSADETDFAQGRPPDERLLENMGGHLQTNDPQSSAHTSSIDIDRAPLSGLASLRALNVQSQQNALSHRVAGHEQGEGSHTTAPIGDRSASYADQPEVILNGYCTESSASDLHVEVGGSDVSVAPRDEGDTTPTAPVS